MRLTNFNLYLIIGSFLVLTSCKKETNNNTNNETLYGAEVAVGNGKAQTFFTASNSGVPQEIGVIFTGDAFSGLPNSNKIYPLEFPQKAIDATLFEHVALGLSAHGHGLQPSGSIGPHFDFRFFMMTLAERMAIPAPAASPASAGGGFDVAPPAGYLPANYAMNAPVVEIGRHWSENIFKAGDHVDHTMIYGTWNGKLTFINPIVTLPTLASATSVSVDYPQPQQFTEKGYYATKYNIAKDGQGRRYVSLSHFVSR